MKATKFVQENNIYSPEQVDPSAGWQQGETKDFLEANTYLYQLDQIGAEVDRVKLQTFDSEVLGGFFDLEIVGDRVLYRKGAMVAKHVFSDGNGRYTLNGRFTSISTAPTGLGAGLINLRSCFVGDGITIVVIAGQPPQVSTDFGGTWTPIADTGAPVLAIAIMPWPGREVVEIRGGGAVTTRSIEHLFNADGNTTTEHSVISPIDGAKILTSGNLAAFVYSDGFDLRFLRAFDPVTPNWSSPAALPDFFGLAVANGNVLALREGTSSLLEYVSGGGTFSHQLPNVTPARQQPVLLPGGELFGAGDWVVWTAVRDVRVWLCMYNVPLRIYREVVVGAADDPCVAMAEAGCVMLSYEGATFISERLAEL
jgi:hypothetical protein